MSNTRADTQDDPPVTRQVWVLVASAVVDGYVTGSAHGTLEGGVQVATDMYQLELDCCGQFLEPADRAAALERFRRNLIRERPVKIGSRDVRLICTTVDL